METLLMQVEAGYAKHGNPYHNHMHACDVLQTVHYFISTTGLAVSGKKQEGSCLRDLRQLGFKSV